MSNATVNDNSKSSGPVPLTPELKAARDELALGVKELMYRFTQKGENVRDELQRLGAKAHALHAQLVSQGTPPRFSKHFLENREVDPSEPEFYNHVHSIEYLVKFIDEQSANDDPIDVTVGARLRLRFFCRRWGHEEAISMERTDAGWLVSYVSAATATDRDGLVEGDEATGLYDLLDRESVSYPRDLSSWIERVWEMASDDGANVDELQSALDRVGAWITMCEQGAPNDDVFSSMKVGK